MPLSAMVLSAVGSRPWIIAPWWVDVEQETSDERWVKK
jgi:hypothetical protein